MEWLLPVRYINTAILNRVRNKIMVNDLLLPSCLGVTLVHPYNYYLTFFQCLILTSNYVIFCSVTLSPTLFRLQQYCPHHHWSFSIQLPHPATLVITMPKTKHKFLNKINISPGQTVNNF